MRTLACLLILVAVVAASPVTSRGKKAITRAYEHCKQKLKEALQDADPSMLVIPLNLLTELEITGKADQDYIASFGRGEDVEDQFRFSVNFWKNKMAEVIKPYVDDPEEYLYGIMINFEALPDPKGNVFPEYKETEIHINGLVLIAMDEMNKVYEKELKKTQAKELKDATASSWAKLRLERILELINENVKNEGQYAKRTAAGGDYSESLEQLKTRIRFLKDHFSKEVQSIFKEYQETTDN